jgi:predicted NAD/FAD-binding protein
MSPLPRTPRARASWNYRTWTEEGRPVTSTHYWMNSLQGLTDRENYVVTINRPEQIAPEKVIRTIPCEHPLFTVEGIAAQQEVQGLNERPDARTHFVGAWQRYGFHEDGLWSAHRLCSFLLGRDAWES